MQMTLTPSESEAIFVLVPGHGDLAVEVRIGPMTMGLRPEAAGTLGARLMGAVFQTGFAPTLDPATLVRAAAMLLVMADESRADVLTQAIHEADELMSGSGFLSRVTAAVESVESMPVNP